MTPSNFVSQIKAEIATLTDPQLTVATVDISNCDREPIHIPAAIQPHGVLLTFSEADRKILQVSHNTLVHLGWNPADLLGQPLSILLNKTQIQRLEECLAATFEAVNPLRLEIAVDESVQIFSGIVHRSENIAILELEPLEIEESVNFFDFYKWVKQPINQLQRAQTLAELCQIVVEEVQQITGFDRVMVYQFDAKGAGKVIAEVKPADCSPYLGLHYPSSDIPQQAKYLYILNRLRLIPDAAYQPIPLVPPENPLTGHPLDMSLATLRSVSPLHQEYLHNMGVGASLSISLVRDHQLWGLIACHHASPRHLSYERRTICEFLGQVISLEIGTQADREAVEHNIKLKVLQTSFIETLTASQSLNAGLTQAPERLLTLMTASGVAYCEKGDIILLGETPPLAAVASLVQWLGDRVKTNTLYQTACLSQDYPAAATFGDTASGLLALAISQVQQIYILWFRPEVVQTIAWAGDPYKPVTIALNGEPRLSPRQSFELWKQTVHLTSLPWQSHEIDAALELRSAVIGIVLKKVDELAQLNLELEQSNIELDAFAYIASHDLKEPLRGIHNYSSFLIEDYGEQLDAEGVAKLQTIMRLTQRMEDLINSLLHYSRLGRAELSMETVDLTGLVDSVIEVLRISKLEPVSFRIPRSLPMLKCDRTRITELFTNLISNGIKYNDKAVKWIEIGYLTTAEVAENPPWSASGVRAWPTVNVFYVRDNGIGIRPQHLETIFRIFKRLHPPGKFGGGTGAGLTIAQKIVERHRGQIWVNSVYGEGSTFYFTLEESGNV